MRLVGWKGRYLSKGGKLILLRNVLLCLPIYFLSLFAAPAASVVNRLERLQREF